MNLRQLSFYNFKSFGNTNAGKIDGLEAINLIFGDNSSGKSNILKFLNLLFSKKMLKENIEVEGTIKVRELEQPFYSGTITDQPYIFHKNNRSIPITFDVSIEVSRNEAVAGGFDAKDLFVTHFFKKGTPTVVEIKGSITSSGDPYTSTIKLESVTLSKQVIYSDTGKSKEWFAGIEGLTGEVQIFDNFLGIFNDCFFLLDKDRYLIPEKEDASIKTLMPHTFKNWVHNNSLNAINYAEFENYVKFIQKYGSKIEVLKTFSPTFSKEPGGLTELFISNGSERLPITSFGTGVQQMLLTLSMIFETKARIILIEELELNLSPNSQQKLLLILTELLNDKVIDQVILTSHSGIVAETSSITTYEVTIKKGISSVKKIERSEEDEETGTLDSTFFERDSDLDKQMRKSYIPNPPGDEWEK